MAGAGAASTSGRAPEGVAGAGSAWAGGRAGSASEPEFESGFRAGAGFEAGVGAGGCGAVAVVSGCWSGVSSGAGVVAGWSGEEVRWRVETSASGRPGPGRAAGAWGAAVAGAGVVDEVVDRRGAGTVTGSEVRAAPGWSPSGPDGG
ncbi:hypothetical protein ABT362_51810, partial [Nonomuraea rubra]